MGYSELIRECKLDGKMLAVTEECFFHSPVWKPVRNRLRREEHLEDVKFSGLA